MSQVIVIDLPATKWRPIRPTTVIRTDDNLLVILSLLLAVAFCLFAVSISAGATLATASALALVPTMLAASFAIGAFILEGVKLWIH